MNAMDPEMMLLSGMSFAKVLEMAARGLKHLPSLPAQGNTSEPTARTYNPRKA